MLLEPTINIIINTLFLYYRSISRVLLHRRYNDDYVNSGSTIATLLQLLLHVIISVSIIVIKYNYFSQSITKTKVFQNDDYDDCSVDIAATVMVTSYENLLHYK